MPSDARPGPFEAASPAPRRLHPLTLLFEAFDEAGALLVPAVVGGAWAGGGHMARMAGWMLLLLVVPSALWAVAEYLTFRYRLTGEGLVLDQGVLRRRHRVIPMARVQSIDVRQSALQRLLGVAELHVETAGGEAAEAVLSVLSAPEAEALRAELLSQRGAAEPGVAAAPNVLARLSARDLAMAGATSNEAGVIAALLIGAVELAYQFGVPLPIPGVDLRALAARPLMDLAPAIAAGAAVVFALAWIFSIAGALLTYYGFSLERTRDELHKRYGALARRGASVPLGRVQAVRVRESLLRRPLGLAALQIETAGAAPGQGQHRGVEAFLPLARIGEVPRLITAVFEDLDFAALHFRPVHPRARIHTFVRYSVPLLGLAALLAVLIGPGWLWLALLLPLLYGAAHLHVRHLGYAVAPGYVALRAGFLTRTTWIIPERRIQTLHVYESRLQRRLGLATLGVDTAAGEAAAVDLGAPEAGAILSELAKSASRVRS